MKIRLASDEDYTALADLRRNTITNVNSKDYSEDVITSWSTKVSEDDFKENAAKCKRWVALEGERIIGFCEHTFQCELSRLYVHKDYLRKGVGSQLLKVAEDSLKKQGCKEVSTESTITAKNFYEKNGYTINQMTTYNGNKNAPVYKMSKKLHS